MLMVIDAACSDTYVYVAVSTDDGSKASSVLGVLYSVLSTLLRLVPSMAVGCWRTDAQVIGRTRSAILPPLKAAFDPTPTWCSVERWREHVLRGANEAALFPSERTTTKMRLLRSEQLRTCTRCRRPWFIALPLPRIRLTWSNVRAVVVAPLNFMLQMPLSVTASSRFFWTPCNDLL